MQSTQLFLLLAICCPALRSISNEAQDTGLTDSHLGVEGQVIAFPHPCDKFSEVSECASNTGGAFQVHLRHSIVQAYNSKVV